MKESEIRKIVESKGYNLKGITRFKKKDRIHFEKSDLKVSLDIGKKIEDISEKEFLRWIF